ncbi:hypothetical protein [Corallococcus carmarthensis]|uniref:hypothetical protein n=1 Tax=Corallococcus carmarthensis TaxID=2316728 RepID=UPI001ABF8D9D|nr:hypothetical protein [Corallococcus carmarthensis]
MEATAVRVRDSGSSEQHVDAAIQWVLGLSPQDALRKAGCLAEGFWLRDLLENFWRPT